MIEFINIEKKYPNGNFGIKNFNLKINEGEFMVFIGPSGSGKTTALKMINRLEDATSGEMRVFGKNILEYNLHKLRWEMGYAMQQVALFPHLNVEENIATVPNLIGWSAEKTNARIDELLELMGLSPKIYRKRMPNELSGGEAQRVGIARALSADPKIILMDEPFSALDPVRRAELQQDIKNLQKKIHKTIVFVTHDIDEAFLLGDRICVINQGEIAQCGTKEELLRTHANDFVKKFVASGTQTNPMENLIRNLIEQNYFSETNEIEGEKLDIDDDSQKLFEILKNEEFGIISDRNRNFRISRKQVFEYLNQNKL